MRTVKLGDVCEFKPKKAQAKQLLDGKDLISFAPMELLPINQKYFTSTEERSLDSVYPSYTYFEENDVIYAKITPCFENGKLSIAKNLQNGVGFGSSEFVPIRCSDKILPEYLYYFLLNPSFIKNGIPKMTGASGHRRVPNEYTENLEIGLPSLEEQRRIVARLDAAFEKISAAEVLTRQNLDNVSALQKSILDKYLSASNGTYAHRLGDVCIFVNGDRGKNYPSKSKQTTSGIPFINAGHLTDGTLSMDSMNYISRETYEKLGSGKIKPGDILYCLRGSLGKFASVGSLQEGAIASSLIIVRPDANRLSQKYLSYYFASEKAAVMIDNFRNGAAQPNLSAKSLASYTIDLPDIDTQEIITKKLDNILSKIRTVEAHYQKKLANLADLRQSLLAEAFSTTNTV